ncbi:hypothetical protein CBL_03567 [Carabus blaptoides fortunei]
MKHTEEITVMLNKYNKEESLLDELLNEKISSKQNITGEESPEKKLVDITLEEAVKRNKELIQELELAKGRLRSKAIFSPMEIQWDCVCRKYQDTPALAVTTWKCHLPVFV